MRARPVLVALGAALLPALALGLWWTVRASPPKTVRVATGAAGGTWDSLGTGLAAILRAHLDGTEVEAVRTAGSVENMARLERGDVELALVQNDTPGNKVARTIAPLYDEVLHVVVRETAEPRIEDISHLRGRAVAIGPPGSGTTAVARRVLEHFGLGSGMRARQLDLPAAMAAFSNGEIDAVFVFAALPNEAVSKLLGGGQGRLLALGECDREGSAVDGLCVGNPYFTSAVVPARSYGMRPARPVGTISVTALLVGRADLDDGFVREIARLVFQNKVGLAQSHLVAAHLSETFDASKFRFPLHEGAVSWYHRRDPSFFVRYAEVMSLAFTMLVAVASALLAARQWMRRKKKNRIDVYYQEIETVAESVRSASREDLGALEHNLEDVRRRAFQDLVRERLLADESFRIFQNFLQGEAESIRGRRQELDREDGESARA